MHKPFLYEPLEYETERASNGYLMSLLSAFLGTPLPIVNLIAIVIFFIGNRKGSYFIRWHCTQVLLSQLSLFIINSFGFWWTIHVILGWSDINNRYIGYILTVFIINVTELVMNIYAAIKVRQGIHIEWWLYGPFTSVLCKP